MDPVLDRVRAANPVSVEEFTGRTNFEALDLAPRRRRRRLLTLPVLGAVAAALVALPNSAPQASEVLERAVQAVAVDDGGILYARSQVRWGPTGGAPAGTDTREVWVHGDTAMRWLEGDGAEEVFAKGEGITRRTADGTVTEHPEMGMVPNEVFRARGLLERARGVGVEEGTLDGRDVYVLRWKERSGPPHWPTIARTMWVDRETYAPVRFIDRSFGKDVQGRPLDHTYVEDILEFETLPNTPENRDLLELG